MNRLYVRAGGLLMALSIAVLSAVPAFAHEGRDAAGHHLEVGWAEEPAFAGFKNAVALRVSEGGKGVAGLQMKVEVIFGDKDGPQKLAPLDLEAVFGDVGHYEASIIPTRSGKYTFHITGSLDDEPFDQFFTSSDETFDNVTDPREKQFPEKDPSAGELGELTNRLKPRLDAVSKSAESKAKVAGDHAKKAQALAYSGIGVSVVALILAAVSLLTGRKRAA